jgi:putative hydrolase of the HAD superfamily
LEIDLGISRTQFRDEFIFKDFMNEVIIGKKPLYDALEIFLPTAGFYDDPQIVIDYWLMHDANINHDLINKIKVLSQALDINLYIATNQEHNRAQYLMENLGFKKYFKDIFHSAKIGVTKSNPEYYQSVEKRIGDFEHPLIFFDDTPDIILAAQQAGWLAYEFCTVQDLYRNDFVAAALNEIKNPDRDENIK